MIDYAWRTPLKCRQDLGRILGFGRGPDDHQQLAIARIGNDPLAIRVAKPGAACWQFVPAKSYTGPFDRHHTARCARQFDADYADAGDRLAAAFTNRYVGAGGQQACNGRDKPGVAGG
ncbi:MAG: hypothetical protein V7664_04190 [Qipengyuania sp.]|uniref:hypothetical protein n=1 Tax=Qipengyuania sp. TaxID=2004515 RepID=UPI00300159BB